MSSWNVITNTETLMSKIISNILPATSQLDILVWFFYFSWFKGIYKELWDKEIRILVWMDTELKIVNSVNNFFYSNKNRYHQPIKRD